MTNTTTCNTDTSSSDTKTIAVNGWGVVNASTTITAPKGTPLTDIPSQKKIRSIWQEIQTRGYNPKQFHIDINCTENTGKQPVDNGEQYGVHGTCKYGATTTFEVQTEKPIRNIPHRQLQNELRDALRQSPINTNPIELGIEIDEILVV